ncbi:MAG: response regulator [Bdellovibrionaceae bacterium]|nr:response regulator [Bdellovibrio sp.]
MIVNGLAQPSRILIVDDEFIFSSVLEEVLLDDHEVFTAESGTLALALVNQGQRFNVIISDIYMPSMGGIELYKAIKNIDPKQAERIIFVSAESSTASTQAFLKSIPNKKLVKPFKLKELRVLMNTFRAQ